MGSEGFAEFDEKSQSTYVPHLQAEEDHPIVTLWNYILLLARYDTSYDLRDRTRLYKALLAVPSSTQLASLMLLAPKPVPHTPSPSESRTGFTLGSASLVVGDTGGLHGLRGYEALPDWVEAGREPDPSLREADTTKTEYDPSRLVPAGERLDSAVRDSSSRLGTSPSSTNGFVGGVAKEKTLDDWLAEGENEEDESDEEESEEETEEESSEEVSDAEESSEDDENEHDRLVK